MSEQSRTGLHAAAPPPGPGQAALSALVLFLALLVARVRLWVPTSPRSSFAKGDPVRVPDGRALPVPTMVGRWARQTGSDGGSGVRLEGAGSSLPHGCEDPAAAPLCGAEEQAAASHEQGREERGNGQEDIIFGAQLFGCASPQRQEKRAIAEETAPLVQTPLPSTPDGYLIRPSSTKLASHTNIIFEASRFTAPRNQDKHPLVKNVGTTTAWKRSITYV
ncbi:hypothetical protein U9M48_040640 [Paspalum notatum var. saurae]|uniref:Uncharacterized protein n=1 Tax=Paspalum notatum var. saurae TaxID=547442 RepID=A0AAQ3XFS1_PASNO